MRAGAEFCGATGMRKGDGEREERKQGSDAEGGAFPADDYVAVK